MTLKDAADAAKAFTAALNGEVVDEDTLLQRSEVCRKCPQNRKATRLPSKLSRILGSLANSKRMSRQLTDRACGVCGCSLALLVPAQKKDLHQDSEAERKRRPSTCWFNES